MASSNINFSVVKNENFRSSIGDLNFKDFEVDNNQTGIEYDLTSNYYNLYNSETYNLLNNFKNNPPKDMRYQ